MIYEIDQSGKIEDTQHDTIIALANGQARTIRIRAREKRILQKMYRDRGKPRIFIYRTFAILIAILLIENVQDVDRLIIDIEYPGQDHIIKGFLLHELWKKQDFSKQKILFALVGKKSNAHIAALAVTHGEPPDREVTASEIFTYIL